MNIINLKGEDLEKILKLPNDVETLKKIWLILADKGFIYDRFILKLDFMQQEFRVKIKNELVNNQRVIQIVKVQNDDHGLPLKLMKYETNATSYLKMLADYIKEIHDKSFAELISQKRYNDDLIDIVVPMSFMQYTINESSKRERVEIEPKERKSVRRSKRTSKSQNKEYSLFDCIKVYKKRGHNLNGYTYQVESFERRGYFRHYKNGKTIFVRPTTVKPKKNGETKIRKEYKL